MQPENQERCRSGRTGQSRKLLNSLWVPGVRIPLFPQKGPGAISAGAFLRKEGDGRQSRPFLPPSKPSPSEGLVASLREGSGPVFLQNFLNLPAALPFSLHNGSRFRISLPLWNGFSAASLLWASWTALSLRPPSTTAAISAFPCRCGMAFPPHPCYGLPGRHCLSGHLPQRQQFPHFPAVAEWLFRRILAMGFLDGIVSPVPFHNGSNSCISLPLWNFFSAASLLWASWTALSLRAPSTTALITAFSCRCGKIDVLTFQR